MYCRKGASPCFARLNPFPVSCCHGFWLQSVTFVHCSQSVWPIRFAHKPSSFRSSTSFPHRWRQSEKYAYHTSVAYTFLLPCGGSATCWRLPSLNTESRELFCWHLPLAYCHATQNKPRMCYAAYLQYLQRSPGKRMAQDGGAGVK